MWRQDETTIALEKEVIFMAKTKEELQKLQEDCKVLATKLQELTDEELEEVAGGVDFKTNLSPFLTIDPDGPTANIP